VLFEEREIGHAGGGLHEDGAAPAAIAAIRAAVRRKGLAPK
jgi:hypothetical protein